MRRLRDDLTATLAAQSASPWLSLALSTGFVFALALAWGWAEPLAALNCGGGQNYCMWNGNPCPSLTDVTCVPTGPGYTCVRDNTTYTEGYWSLQRITPFPMCTTPATSSGKSCSDEPATCGTVTHFVSGNQNCFPTCTGTWYWSSCKAIGNQPPC